MNKRPGKGSLRVGSPKSRLGLTGNRFGRSAAKGIYIGPSVDGSDKEYVKVVSGKVSDSKPSFA